MGIFQWVRWVQFPEFPTIELVTMYDDVQRYIDDAMPRSPDVPGHNEKKCDFGSHNCHDSKRGDQMAKFTSSKVNYAHKVKWFTPKEQAKIWDEELQGLLRQFTPRK